VTESLSFLPAAGGVLPKQTLIAAAEHGLINAPGSCIPEESFQPASVDLRLGDVAYRLQCSFLPGDQTVEEKLRHYAMDTVDLTGGAVLETNRPYLIPLVEELRLPGSVRARTNPKSSTGRVDIFTRVVTDRSYRFDEIREGYQGKLYLEVFTRSFTVRVAPGLSLNQLRMFSDDAGHEDSRMRGVHLRTPILFRGGEPVPDSELEMDRGLFLSVDLTPASGGKDVSREAPVVGYKAKADAPLLDLTATTNVPEEFWDAIWRGDGRLVLGREQFYLLRSREHVRIPPHFAAEMVAYDPTAGELRTHYAGFFDPGFGYSEAGGLNGTAAVLEVRAHDVAFAIEDGQQVCKLSFEQMAEPPSELYGKDSGSHYQGQRRMLSKHFKPFSGRPG
jgi:dCTP deaminase